MIEEELARCGITRTELEQPPRNELVYFDGDNWELDPALLLEFLGPVPDKKPIAEQIARLIGRLDYRAAYERLYTTPEEQARVREDFVRFWVSAFGCWFSGEYLLDQELRFRLRMPGALIFCDGDMGQAPEVRWFLHGLFLAFADEELHAVSFAPIEGIPRSGWTLTGLLSLRDDVRRLDPEQRSRLPGLVVRAIGQGQQDLVSPTREDWELYQVVKSIRESAEAASRHAQDRQREGVED